MCCLQVHQVIITSFLFPSGKFGQDRLDAVLAALGGDKNKLVIDLSCRKVAAGGDDAEDKWFVAMNKWQTITDMEVNQGKCCQSVLSSDT
jgi:phosphoribosylformimino-5-aminoimidazole carboxamide ribotide isomerase